MMINKRAVTEDAKLRKKEHILYTAYKCFEETNFKDLKMIDIAKDAGVAKGTLFNYFKTKEHLFLEMLYYEYEQRFFNTERLLTAEKENTSSHFKNFIIKELELVLDNECILIKLESIKSVILEVNLDQKIALDLKNLFEEQLYKISEKVACYFKDVSTEEVIEIFNAQKAIIIGFYHITSKLVHNDSCDNIFEFRQKAKLSMKYFLDGYFSERSRND